MEGDSRSGNLRLLVLGAGPAQLGLLEAAHERGLWIAVVDRDPAAPGFRFADRRCILSTEDEPAIERLITALAIDGIVSPGTDWPVGVAARVAERAGLPHPIEPATAVLATNKLRQRERLAEALPLPELVRREHRRRRLDRVREPAALGDPRCDADRPVRPRRDDPVDPEGADQPLDRRLVLGREDAAAIGEAEAGRGGIAVDHGDPEAARTRRLEQTELSGTGP